MKNRMHQDIRNNFAALRIYGKPRSQVIHEMTTYPQIEDTSALQSYFLNYASPEHFIKNQHQGIYFKINLAEESVTPFIIIYQGCTRSQILQAVKDDLTLQVKLSFRTAHPEYDLPSYVLVSLP